MGLFRCQVCRENLMDVEGPHVCDPKKAHAHVEELEEDVRHARRQLDDIRDAVQLVLHELPDLDGERVEVKAEWLRRLWQAAGCQWEEAKTADSFLSRWLATHWILCVAFDLFRSEPGVWLEKLNRKATTRLEKLRVLREACERAAESLGYKDSAFDVSPEDLDA